MKATINILLQAKDEKGNMHDVKCVEMGGYTTRIEFYEPGLSSNSVDYKFYLNGYEIDIYSSALFNPYMEATIDNLVKKIPQPYIKPKKDDFPF